MKFTFKGHLLLTIAILGFLHAPSASAQVATGGTVTTSGAYTIHTFTSGGTFTLTTAATLDVVIVAGGGGGGHQHAGGAGGGGVVSVGGLGGTAQSYTITVGDGGAGCTWYPYTGNNGGNSVAFGYTAIGGGAGTGMSQAGNSGGSGGAAGYPSGGVQGGAGTSGQGNSGNTTATGSIFNGGGGGGAGGPGNGINGGAPLSTWAGTFAGGGGGGYGGGAGGGASAGAGGAGAAYGSAAAANTGSGGGGGGNMDAFGGNGGSGIVVIRYLTPVAANPSTTNTSSLGASMFFGQTTSITANTTVDAAHGDSVFYTLIGVSANVPGATVWNDGAPYYVNWAGNSTNPTTYAFTPTALGAWTFGGLEYTAKFWYWGNWGPGVTVTVNKATPSGTFAARSFSPSGSTYTVLAGDLNAAFPNPYSGAVAAPTGAVTYSIVGPGTTVSAGTVLSAGQTYTVRASSAGDTNYNATIKDATWTVSQVAQTISFGALSAKTYGNASFAVSATASSGLPVSFSIVSGPASVSGSTVTLTGTGTVTVRASQAGNGTFGVAPNVDQSFAVAKATLTVTASNLAKSYGAANPTCTQTYSGYVNGDTLTVLTGSPSVTTTATGSSPVGSYPITAALGTLVAANYQFSFASGTLTVTKATATGTFAARSIATGGGSYTVLAADLNATFTGAGAAPTGTVTYSLVGPGTAVTAGTVFASGSSYTVRASYPGDANYNATSVDSIWSVAASNQTITFGALSGRTYGNAPFTVAATASSGLAVTFSVLSGPATIAGNTVTITGAGTVTIRAAQAGNASFNPATPVDQAFAVATAPLTVTAASPSKTYGAANPPLTFSYSGFVNSDTAAVLSGAPSLSTTAVQDSPPGSYTVTTSLGTLSAANYSITPVNGALTVNKATPILLAGSFVGRTVSIASDKYKVRVGDLAAAFKHATSTTATPPGGAITYLKALPTPTAAIATGSAIDPLGTCTIRATIAEDTNYFSTTSDVIWTISKSATDAGSTQLNVQRPN